MNELTGTVAAVARDTRHRFSKPTVSSITLIEGLGIEGDAHAGVTVQHRSRVAKNPTQPNLRQVHLIEREVLRDLNARGFRIQPGMLGENVTTEGLNLISLPTGTRLHLGSTAIVEVTGLRNPCVQIEDFHEGLLAAVIERDATGLVRRKTGIMGIVIAGGVVQPGDTVRVEWPQPPHMPLDLV